MTKKKAKSKIARGSRENVKTRSKSKRHSPTCKCKFCGVNLNTIENKTQHELNCEGRKAANVFITLDGKAKFLCKVCNQLFKYQSGLKKHEQRHLPPGGFICSECKQRFLSDTERSLHKESVHKIFKCLICEDKFTSEEEYSKHIDDRHNGRDREYVVCEDCGAQFRQPNQLRLHNESKCGTIRCFSCEQCGSKFMTQNTLNAHVLIHVGEKKYLCNFCGNSYLSRGQLKVHERSHTGEKPFKCAVCDKSFAHRESLVTHSSVHTGVKPYLCENCGSRFSCIGNLIKHRRARPHSCGLPQFNKNTKCAPRASSKNNGSLTMKRAGLSKRNIAKRKTMLPVDLITGAEHSDNIVKMKTINATAKLDMEDDDAVQYTDVNIAEISCKDTEQVIELKDETEAITFDGSFINFEVSAVDGLNEFTIDENWEADEHIQEITETEIFDTSSRTITYNVSDVVVVIKNEQQPTQPEYILSSYDESKLQGVDVGVAISTDGDFQTEGEVVIVDGFAMGDTTDQIEQIEQIEQCILNDGSENQSTVNGKYHIAYAVDDISNRFEEETLDSKIDDQSENSNERIPNNAIAVLSEEEEEAISEPETNLDDVKTFQCDECPGQFRYQRSYLKHMEQCHQKNETSTAVHNRRTSKKAIFKCDYCDKKYTSDKLLKKHSNHHGPDGTLLHRCTCCPKYFATLDDMQKHQMEVHKEKLTCCYCNKMFKDPECVGAHVRYVHTKRSAPPKKYIYVCTKCGKKFNSRVAMSDHERADCGRSPIYKCTACDKYYHSAGSLKTHQLIHSGDLPHLCRFCGKAFRTQGQVKVHERRHNGDKPFKCEYCPKSFGHRESLLTHISLHTGIKRFMCQGCGSRFSCISNLQAHRRSHKTTCGLLPNMTKPVGPMGNEKFSAFAIKPNEPSAITKA